MKHRAQQAWLNKDKHARKQHAYKDTDAHTDPHAHTPTNTSTDAGKYTDANAHVQTGEGVRQTDRQTEEEMVNR